MKLVKIVVEVTMTTPADAVLARAAAARMSRKSILIDGQEEYVVADVLMEMLKKIGERLV